MPLTEIREMFSLLASLSSKCDDLQRRQKEIPSLSLTNQRRLNAVAGRIASLKVLLERRATETPSRSVTRHPSDHYLSDVVPPGWERSFTDDDIPYYVNHSKEVKMGATTFSLTTLGRAKFSRGGHSQKLLRAFFKAWVLASTIKLV